MSQRRGRRRALRQDHIRRDACELRRLLPQTARVAGGPAILDPDVATIPPTKVRERLRKRGNQGLLIGITLISSHQHADAPHLIRLLRACRKWPSSGRSAQQGDEVATFHRSVPPVLPTERIAHLGTADCCIHPPERNEMIAITPPKIFSKEVA